MNGFDKLLLKIEKYNVDKALFEVWTNPKVKEYIISLNTEGEPTSQLYEQGVNSLGVRLTGSGHKTPWLENGQYTAFTIEDKKAKGHRFDHPTLKNTGGFYDSFFVNGLLKGFSIEADPRVTGDNGETDNLFLLESSGTKIVGLTNENLQLLIKFIRPYYIAATKKIVQ